MAKLESIQAHIDVEGYSDPLHSQELTAQIELHQALSFQEAFWKEKTWMKWYAHGDRSTTYFHKVTKIRNSIKQLSILKVGSSVLDKQSDIENHILEFYSNLYAYDNSCSDNGLVDSVIPALVSSEDNSFLTNVPSKEEVKNAVFSLDSSSALGPDGFGGSFYNYFGT